MSPDELARLVRSVHPDPHSLLGPHPDGEVCVVRVLRPDASEVTVLVGKKTRAVAKRIHPDGLFEARLRARPERYELEVVTPLGTERGPDPYAFTPTVGPLDLHLYAEGKHLELHRRLGGHLDEHEGVRGARFAVWAPHAVRVSVVGDFNAWDGRRHAMRRLGQSAESPDGGVWEIFVPGLDEGTLYKFELVTRHGTILKSDPFAQAMQLRPDTASKLVKRRHVFTDEAWLAQRSERANAAKPMSIYEVHLPSWRRRALAPGELGETGTAIRWLSYRELADELVDYVVEQGFTHIELLPILEHPYDGSWGYQVSGYFAPTSRLGSPDDLRYFVDRCHQRGIGVLLDWVPAHFPRDAAALGRFDGTPLYEHWDPRRGEHRHWSTYVFDWGRPQVKNFLIASALAWIEEFHIDGLRVDAVASMLYLDYGADHPSQWEPNVHGGRENLEAVAFLRELNDRIHQKHPGVVVCAEESTSWPGVTKPTYTGGLGFDLKWNMGWMHDTLGYFEQDPVFRAYHHNLLSFGLLYAYSERFLLPLSHDEVVHLKRALVSKMPGDWWQMLANLRALYGWMWAHPGKKLLFMGAELAQPTEWNFATELDWGLLASPQHEGVRRLVADLNRLYRGKSALWQLDDHPDGFRWIDVSDAPQSVVSFVRHPESELASRRTGEHVVFVGNLTPVVRHGYRVGVPRRCDYLELLNTDASVYGGSGIGNMGRVAIEDIPSHGYAQSISLVLPPLGALFLAPVDPGLSTEAERAAERSEREGRTPPRDEAAASDRSASSDGR